jgi:hypothetical protein
MRRRYLLAQAQRGERKGPVQLRRSASTRPEMALSSFLSMCLSTLARNLTNVVVSSWSWMHPFFCENLASLYQLAVAAGTEQRVFQGPRFAGRCVQPSPSSTGGSCASAEFRYA